MVVVLVSGWLVSCVTLIPVFKRVSNCEELCNILFFMAGYKQYLVANYFWILSMALCSTNGSPCATPCPQKRHFPTAKHFSLSTAAEVKERKKNKWCTLVFFFCFFMADRQFQMFRRKTNVHLVAMSNLVHLSLLCDDLGKHTHCTFETVRYQWCNRSV